MPIGNVILSDDRRFNVCVGVIFLFFIKYELNTDISLTRMRECVFTSKRLKSQTMIHV